MFGLRERSDRPDLESPLRRAIRDDAWPSTTVERMAASVGGLDALEALTSEPHDDDHFDWSSVKETERDVVAAILEVATSTLAGERNLIGSSLRLPPVIDGEYRTIAWRLLAQLSRVAPAALHKSSPTRVCAGVFWLAIHASDGFGRGALTADYLWQMFGVSTCSQLGRSLLAAAGIEQPDDFLVGPRRSRMVQLGDPRLLHSEARADLIEQREQVTQWIIDDEHKRDAARPIHMGPNGVELRGRQIVPRWAVRGTGSDGKARVMTVFGEDEDHIEVLGMSVPDARHLITILERAVSSPVPRPRAV